jgi:hypothetical protein
MEPDPLQYLEEDGEKKETRDAADAGRARKLNTLVAISVALLASFMGI